MTYEKSAKNIKFFECKNCDFISYKKGDYTRHIQTQKHKNKLILTNDLEKSAIKKVYGELDDVI